MITRAVLFERFAGRATELAHLTTLRTRSAHKSSGAGISVVGEAGVGKSRLIDEFESATRAERGAFIGARCEELAVAFGPVIAILEGLAVLRELSRNEAVSDALRSVTSRRLGAETGIDERTGAIFEGITAAIVASARRLGQLTLAIEDVHWSDLSSLEAFKRVARASSGVPLLLAITYRPEDAGEQHARATAIGEIERQGFDRIVLEPLPRNDIAMLVREAVPSASASAAQRIYELSEGKPYVAEELARSLTDGDGSFDTTIALSLRGSVLARVERLGATDRKIVEKAAVLGRTFLPDDLHALGASHDQLIDALRAGSRLQLIEEREVDGAPWFRFRHALTREILYRNLLALERRALHLQIAEQLEAGGGRSAELAYHLALAGDARRAVVASERAGDEARDIAAHGDAAILYNRALDFAVDLDHRARIGLKLLRSLRFVETQYDDYVPVTERLVDELANAGRREDAIRMLVTDEAMRACTKSFADIVRWLERAASLIDESIPADLRFEFELLNAHCLTHQGRLQEALDACERAERSAPDESLRTSNRILAARTLAYMYLHRYDDAQRLLDERRIDPLRRDLRGDAHALGHRASLNSYFGRLEESFGLCMEAVAIYERIGNEWGAWRQRYHACFYAAEIGNFDFITATAERAHRDGLEQSHSIVIALLRLTRAKGGAVEPYLAHFESGAPLPVYLLNALGSDLPFMLEDDPPKARDVARRTLDLMPAGMVDGGITSAVIAFGTDEDVADAVARFRAEAVTSAPVPKLESLLVEARLAARERRETEVVEFARAALLLAKKTKQWLHLSSAYELAGDFPSARAVLARVGATAELERLKRRAHWSERAPAEKETGLLTHRELQVARSIADGWSNREAAERLTIGVRTVEAHLLKVYRKLGVSSRSELIKRLVEIDA